MCKFDDFIIGMELKRNKGNKQEKENKDIKRD